jgi:hypothetical protein
MLTPRSLLLLALSLGAISCQSTTLSGPRRDGGHGDAGTLDGGGLDAGRLDAGPPDAGPNACTSDISCAGAGRHCCDSVCVETASCATAVTSLSQTTGFQNGGDYLTLVGAGFAPGMKAFIGDGRAPLLVLDATHARIATPPGPVGSQSLQIVVGPASATLHQAFTYTAAGLEQTWQQKPLSKVRGEDPGMAVMQDGRVLITGGTTVPDDVSRSLDTAEIYDRVADNRTPVTSLMSTPRWRNTAVTLLTGKVLVVGGSCAASATCKGSPRKADLFDPTTNSFTPTGTDLNADRTNTRAVLMVDGRVFIASADQGSIEIYDPATDAFTLVAHNQTHPLGTVVRLRDGRVLLASGDGSVTAAELFDPETDTFTPTASPMVQGRSMLTAHTLPDGRVIFIGGASASAGAITDPLASIEFFNPTTSSFTAAPYSLVTPRCWHASALVRDGTVLVMGGYTVHNSCSSSVATVEKIDPVAGQVTAFPSLLNTNAEWTAVTLLDGSVLGVGGGACGTAAALPDIDFLAGTLR